MAAMAERPALARSAQQAAARVAPGQRVLLRSPAAWAAPAAQATLPRPERRAAQGSLAASRAISNPAMAVPACSAAVVYPLQEAGLALPAPAMAPAAPVPAATMPEGPGRRARSISPRGAASRFR